MKTRFAQTGLVALVILLGAYASSVQAQQVTQKVEQMGNFRVDPPEGCSITKFPVDNRGSMFIDDDKTAGMFFAFEFPGDNPATMTEKMKAAVFERYFPGQPQPSNWTASALPAHPGMVNETAILHAFAGDGAEIQLAEYAMTSGPIRIHYGYFALRHAKKKKKDGPFLDLSGGGVPKFETFWRSITLEN